MALDLTGIDNENEFFSQHYMDSLLERDIEAGKEATQGWDSIRRDWMRSLRRWEEAPDPESAAIAARAACAPIFSRLGYELRNSTRVFEDTEILLWADLPGLVILPVFPPQTGDRNPVDEPGTGRAAGAGGDGIHGADPGTDPDPLETPDDLRDPLAWMLATRRISPQSARKTSRTAIPAEIHPETAPSAPQTPGAPSAAAPQSLSPADPALSSLIFSGVTPPRWVILLNPYQAVLCDRGKWGHKRILRFDWESILSRRAPGTLAVLVSLLHRASLIPDQGRSLLDSLDENSHKHAYGVSEDLKYALRESVELLGNEIIRYLREVRREKVYGSPEEGGLDAAALSRECLRIMYRLLFIFYLEARPELGYIPDSGVYQHGYSLELLRDLELRSLAGEEARNGSFFHESLTRLFDLINTGYPVDSIEQRLEDGLRIAPLRSHLFDPERTPTFNRVKIRNIVWQRIIRLLSLSRPKNRRQRGRISYAQLGINQLGAIYEALLSFQGFFAAEDLIEVRPPSSAASAADAAEADGASDDEAGDPADSPDTDSTRSSSKTTQGSSAFQESDDPLADAYFVPARDQARYRPSEILIEDGRPKRYPKGSFIYRLAGRDREKSASYYTPEVLTRSLVSYALDELLCDLPADRILGLTICEPAMGSAAFLNEAISQLADAYLQRKQTETGLFLSQTDWPTEKQRVKMYLADNNVFGIDLNPVAVELAEVSLWLGTIFSGAFVPWFGLQLHAGNSLVGARYEAGPPGGPYRRTGFQDQAGEVSPSLQPDSALRQDAAPRPSCAAPSPGGAPPAPPSPPSPLGRGEIFHFLVADPAMAAYSDPVVKGLERPALAKLDAWRKAITKPLARDEGERLVSLSAQIALLWKDHVAQLRKARIKTTDALSVWPAPHSQSVARSTAEKDRILERELRSEAMKNSSPYRRLKLVLDFWCALWFWPIDKAELAPEREHWWYLLELIVFGGVWDVNAHREQGELFADSLEEEDIRRLKDHAGFVDVDRLIAGTPCLQVVEALAGRYRFFHWDLEFADIFADRSGGSRGFDLVLGNPPWLKVEWNEAGLLSEYDPLVALRKLSAKETADIRKEIFARDPESRAAYLGEYEAQDGMARFLNAEVNYPLLKKVQTNLYKCFLPQAWKYGKGVAAFLHPEGVYDDPKGGALRSAMYHRLRYHFQFQNELSLFAEVDHHAKYSINVYGRPREDVRFTHLANLYTPATIDLCFSHTGEGQVPGIKDEANRWAVAGHRGRLLAVDAHALELFAGAFDPAGTPADQARLPALHASSLLEVLDRIQSWPKKIADLESQVFSLEMWHETGAQKDGTIRRETRFPADTREWIISGPHIYVGSPFNKSPRATCRLNSDYDCLDLETLPDDYLPRSNYVPACSPEEYHRRTPEVPWAPERKVTEFYRVAFRGMLSQAGERTLVSAILPQLAGHIHGIQTAVFQSTKALLSAGLVTQSILGDFYIKMTGRSNLHGSWTNLPLLKYHPWALRTLSLTCLTTHYAGLWEECWDGAFREERWAKADPRLRDSFFTSLTPTWQRGCALRTAYERRQALVELDVLVARELGLELEQLLDIYRIQFPVMRQYEADTWYDARGRIVFTVSKGLVGVGLPRLGNPRKGIVGWEDVRGMSTGTVERRVLDDSLPGGPVERLVTYHAPFDRVSREADYRIVWEEFKRRGR